MLLRQLARLFHVVNPQLTWRQRRLAFEADASCLPVAAAACCLMLLPLFALKHKHKDLGNQTLPQLGPSDDPGKLCFQTRLTSIRGIGWAEQLLAQLAL